MLTSAAQQVMVFNGVVCCFGGGRISILLYANISRLLLPIGDKRGGQTNHISFQRRGICIETSSHVLADRTSSSSPS